LALVQSLPLLFPTLALGGGRAHGNEGGSSLVFFFSLLPFLVVVSDLPCL